MSILENKKVIIIGDRDGIPGEAIKECVETVNTAEVVFASTECFVWTAAGAFDLEDQKIIKTYIDQNGKEDVVVIIGAPDANSSELYAETLINGDPSWAGPLAGVPLGLPVFHIMEPEIKSQVDPALYKEHLELMEIALDVEKITEGLNRVRKGSS